MLSDLCGRITSDQISGDGCQYKRLEGVKFMSMALSVLGEEGGWTWKCPRVRLDFFLSDPTQKFIMKIRMIGCKEIWCTASVILHSVIFRKSSVRRPSSTGQKSSSLVLSCQMVMFELHLAVLSMGNTRRRQQRLMFSFSRKCTSEP